MDAERVSHFARSATRDAGLAPGRGSVHARRAMRVAASFRGGHGSCFGAYRTTLPRRRRRPRDRSQRSRAEGYIGFVVASICFAHAGTGTGARIVVCAAVVCVTLALTTGGADGAVASAWSPQRTPNPAGARYSVLSGVSCSSRTACIAVGHSASRTGAGVTLAERWNGTTWAIQRTPNPAGAKTSLLFAVSCASTTACTAVGSVTNRAGITVPLAERWNGTRWAIQPTSNPPRANGRVVSYPGSVSCASTRVCVAVGYSGIVSVRPG